MNYILTKPVTCTHQDYLYLLVAGTIVEWLGGVDNHTLVKYKDCTYLIRNEDWEGAYRTLKGGVKIE